MSTHYMSTHELTPPSFPPSAGVEDGLIFAGGVLGSVIYLLLLQIKTDSIGQSPNRNAFNPATVVGSLRFLVPVAIMTGLAAKNVAADGQVCVCIFFIVTIARRRMSG